jgi:hypothetical protein
MKDRSTAFMRDWYLGPDSRKNSSTSTSTLSEIGTFPEGNTGTASSQKSFGSPRSSSGDVRSISRSVRRRSFARFARPTVGTLPRVFRRGEDFAVRLALIAATHSGRNYSTDDIASLSPVGVNHGELDPIGNASGNPSDLTVILARVDALESWADED